MAVITPQEYHEGDDKQHGNYQYVSIETLIDKMILRSVESDDSYLKNVKRYTLVAHAKDAIREINKRAAADNLEFQITVPASLVITLPQDYINYEMVSVVIIDEVTGARRLQPLDINCDINTAIGILQDTDGMILFDDDGFITTADFDNAFAVPYQKYGFANVGGQFRLDTSKLSRFGEFKIDERRGKMLFSSELAEREIVVQYVSDGLQAELTESEITVHKDIARCITDWMYYACISDRRNVPDRVVKRALDRYKTTLHQAKMDRADFNLLQIARQVSARSIN
jgi:hypothetical protein